MVTLVLSKEMDRSDREPIPSSNHIEVGLCRTLRSGSWISQHQRAGRDAKGLFSVFSSSLATRDVDTAGPNVLRKTTTAVCAALLLLCPEHDLPSSLTL